MNKIAPAGPIHRRRPNPRVAKLHRNYTVYEAARTLNVHPNTVREWVKQGLPTNDDRRPTLILGAHLSRFLQDRRSRRKQPCGPGEIFCMRCRAPQFPAGGMADFRRLNAAVGNLAGICPACESLMNRRVSIRNLATVVGNLDVTGTEGLPRITESNDPAVNSDLE